jgi:hypothetical protein
MNPNKVVLVIFLLFFVCGHAVAQREQSMASRHLSKEDLREFLLFKSKREKTKAIGTAIAGPVLTGIGLYLYNKKTMEAVPGGAGMQEKRSPARLIGLLMGSLGITTTVCSIPLFVSAAALKREARLVLSHQSTSYSSPYFALPGLSVQVNF